jgi:thioredoxin 1
MSGQNVKTLTDGNFKAEVLDSEIPVLVDFWAPWCGPCRMVGPIVEELADEYQGKLKVGKINTDENPNTPGSYSIRGIPTIMIFKGGALVNQMVGAAPKAQMKSFIDGAIA